MSAEKDLMVQKMEEYFDKVQQAVATGGSSAFRYLTGTVPSQGQTVIDAPTLLGFVAANYQVYSLGLELRCVDPAIPTNPPVVDAQAILTYQIAADGKVTILNNFSAVVTYHIRVTMPVKK